MIVDSSGKSVPDYKKIKILFWIENQWLVENEDKVSLQKYRQLWAHKTCVCVCECRLSSSPLGGISKSPKMRPIKANNTAAILATRKKKKSSSSRSSLMQEKGFYLSFHPDIIAKHHDETFSSNATVHSIFKDQSRFWWGCLDSLKISSCWSGRRLVPEPAEVNRSWLKLPLDLGHGNDRDTMRS